MPQMLHRTKNIAIVGQPTEQTPNTFSIVDATEKVMDPEIVDSTLLPSQRNIDMELTMDDPREMKASPQLEMDNEEEMSFMLKYAHLMPTAKSLDPENESDEDELSSSEEVVDKEFNKMEFLNKFQKGMTKSITKLIEQPAKTCGNKEHRKKNQHDREVKPRKHHRYG